MSENPNSWSHQRLVNEYAELTQYIAKREIAWVKANELLEKLASDSWDLGFYTDHESCYVPSHVERKKKSDLATLLGVK